MFYSHPKTFKYELRPDVQQERHMRCFAGSYRFMFNKTVGRGVRRSLTMLGCASGSLHGALMLQFIPATVTQGLGTCLCQPLRQTDRFPTFQEDTLSQQP
ncbi:helix-turn-helix domain-containing protein [Xylella fastidiosa]|uniref:helix-turn-helix domain-containing protein n=1 Tax=Xylella fastidiosa TaxID=2371 RepID=UPI0012BCF368|nr:helix-turn-helix domain-containing protein [Xylella fastidiosa]UIX82512.1 helix-turn-helix domain-containing protein [Xylella fastidiosa subsp. sandyi]